MDYVFEDMRKKYFEWLLGKTAELNPALAANEDLFREFVAVRRPENVEVNIKGSIFSVKNIPLCSFGQLVAVHEIIEAKYQKLVGHLLDNHVCKYNPVFPEMFLYHLNRNIFGSLEKIMTEEEYHLLLLAAGAYQIGRVQMEPSICDSIDLTMENVKSRGALSLEVLRGWGIIDIFLPDAQEVLITAISQNDCEDFPALIVNPADDPPTDSQKIGHLFVHVLRDMHTMRELAYGLACFFCKEKIKAKHNSRNSLQGEQGKINPPELIAEFILHRRFDKSKCCSYESWALWYLSQIFDINLGLVFKEICQTGIISQFLDYLRDQLPNNQYGIIENAMETYIRDEML